MTYRLAALAAAAVGSAMVLTACSQTPTAPTADPLSGTNRPSSSSSSQTMPPTPSVAVTTASPPPSSPATSSPATSSSTTDDSTGTAKFGGAFKWKNGVQVTVSAPAPFTPSKNAAVGEPRPAHFVKIEIVVVNGATTIYDPSAITVSAQSANVEAKKVYDSDMGSSPSTKVLSGREAKFSVAFGVVDPKDLVVQVRPGFEYRDALWTS